MPMIKLVRAANLRWPVTARKSLPLCHRNTRLGCVLRNAIRPRRRVSVFVWKNFPPVWLTVHSYPVKSRHRKRIFSTSLFRVEIFENAGFAFTCERAKTEVFKYDDVIYHTLLALRMLCKGCFRILVSLSLTVHRMPHIYRFSVFVWTRGGGGYSLKWPVYCNL